MLKKMKKFSFALILSLMLMVFTVTAVPCFCAFADEATTVASEEIVDTEASEIEKTDDEIILDAAAPETDSVETVGAEPAKETADKEDEPDFALRPDSWKQTLPSLVIGMLGIFLVIGVIIVATYLLNKGFSKKKDKEE